MAGRDQPRTRKDCENIARPCRFKECRHNIVNKKTKKTSCVLDVVEDNPNGLTNQQIADLFGCSRETIRLLIKNSVGTIRHKITSATKDIFTGNVPIRTQSRATHHPCTNKRPKEFGDRYNIQTKGACLLTSEKSSKLQALNEVYGKP